MNPLFSEFINICKFGIVSDLQNLVPLIDLPEYVNTHYNAYPNVLFLAVEYRQFDIVKYFINKGFDINQLDTEGQNVLFFA